MSWSREVTVTVSCDGRTTAPGCAEQAKGPTLAQARRNARDRGWVRLDGRDICRGHAARLAAGDAR